MQYFKTSNSELNYFRSFMITFNLVPTYSR